MTTTTTSPGSIQARQPATREPSVGRPQPRILLCAEHGDQHTEPDDGAGNGLEGVYTVDPLVGKLEPFVVDDRSNICPVWSPDRSRIALCSSASYGTPLRVLDAATGTELYSLPRGWWPRWLDDDTLLFVDDLWLASSAGDLGITELAAVHLPTGTLTQLTQLGPDLTLANPHWHPVAGLTMDVRPRGSNPWTTEEVVTVPHAVLRRALTAAGRRVGPADLKRLRPWGSGWCCAQPRWSPDGRHVVLVRRRIDDGVTGGPDLAVVDVRSGATNVVHHHTETLVEDPSRPGEDVDDYLPVYSPDGRQIAWNHGFRDHWRELWVMNADGSRKRQVTQLGHRWVIKAIDW
jgi:hypothetical protein